MELSERGHRNQILIEHYAQTVRPCMAACGGVTRAEWRPTCKLLRAVCALSDCLGIWNTQRASCKPSVAVAAARSFKRILEDCEKIISLIDAGNVDQEVLEFDYRHKDGVRHYVLRAVICTQQAEMLGDKTKDAAYAAYMQAAQAAVLARARRVAQHAQLAYSLERLGVLAGDER